jgi:hypothetical protein
MDQKIAPESDLAAAVASIVLAFAAADQPAATYRALDQAVDQLYGRVFLTILRVESDVATERVFTSDVRTYPLGAGNALPRTAGRAAVLERGEPFLAINPDEIREHFAGGLALSLGADSLGNFPALFGDRVVGMVNVGGAGWTEHARVREGIAALVRVIGPVLARFPH